MITYILFILGFILLIKGADLLVDGSASIAKKLKISSIVIGLTIVAFGTSAPEFIVNIFASVQGNSEIAIGNILGSNIANILLILGISAIIYPITAKKNTVLKEIPLSLLAAVVLGFMANDMIIDGASFSGITRIDGFILLSFFIIFLYYTFGITKSDTDIVEEKMEVFSYSKAVGFIILGLAGLVIGGKWIVDGAVKIAVFFNISQSLIGLTIVAIGTSLPELATSAIAAYKKQSDIALGNVVGSNIFNIFWILGVSAIIRPLPFNTSSNGDIAMTIFASIILFIVMFIGKKRVIERWQGVFMVTSYVGYVVFLVLTK
ncbi:MAG: sodium:proton exchanger [Candidatus Magasanikbacteria bacterium RIFCSPHIGHO2_01_FULL_41_23]|uniref:Sodium:proton exchanger n=1 Tax=Candidatus Magasanikbacteria bacterium RIFCSPLOWO2_01_FULL_40_15 TaxID=1798686 RepID=A0A1F6N3Q0_9BACT|nr:MAG: sodium:proton exchanger [Candidatus Magasanikbacteria bacterium RIFCSPHIGHO2_01_FULL_41_23]OGH67379.1 MAG: sodium:proton exchanger [Candidatus Magasanikbacteria bacterium RIFCSPHIGHO2_02_FULL_41_35]OGH74611.1 MAG: sodium:proton exchanger [Candidatus Magasanikbacteria bacterium RIFCSPHIGHO2_12_FULL_41_16]OGH78616.1 MAG: sodium:proton exchanger [Candidatus Magasanikbacteria bacterium RIFCSPLOWO2_01_FULL_40_15]